MIALELILALFVVLTAVLVALFRGPLGSTAIFAAFSLGLAVIWLLLAAPDVALTEAAVGAGVMVFLLLIAAVRTGVSINSPDQSEQGSIRSLNLPALVVTLVLAIPLVYSTLSFPDIGDPEAQAVSEQIVTGEPSPYASYVGEAAVDIGIPNVVASVLTVFRNLDTLGEVVVAFTAVIGVLIVYDHTRLTGKVADEPGERASNYPDPYVMSTVGMTAVRLVVPLVFAFGIYLVLKGAVLPGGGFSGGVVIGSAFVLMALIFGHVPTSDWIDERHLVGALVLGLVLFLAVAVGSLAFGGELLEVLAYQVDLTLVIEVMEVAIGMTVGAVVIGLVLAMALGLEEDDFDTADDRGDGR